MSKADRIRIEKLENRVQLLETKVEQHDGEIKATKDFALEAYRKAAGCIDIFLDMLRRL